MASKAITDAGRIKVFKGIIQVSTTKPVDKEYTNGKARAEQDFRRLSESIIRLNGAKILIALLKFLPFPGRYMSQAR
jgi:hypothetical protein